MVKYLTSVFTIFYTHTRTRTRARAHTHIHTGDGFISQDEMVKYLTSVFTVLYETSPDTKQNSGVSASQLAQITTRQCFQDADTDGDGVYVCVCAGVCACMRVCVSGMNGSPSVPLFLPVAHGNTHVFVYAHIHTHTRM